MAHRTVDYDYLSFELPTTVNSSSIHQIKFEYNENL